MAKPRPLPKVDLGETETDSAMFDDLAGKPETRVIVLLDPNTIDPSPQQARTVFDPEDIHDFANVMREVGFTSVIWVRPHPTIPGRYILIYGERRLRAAKEVVQDVNPKFTKISCEIRADIVDPELLEFLGFFENNQRKDLPPYDEALYYRKLLDRRDSKGGKPIYTLEKLAARAHVTENHIRDRLFLLELPDDALAAYRQNPHMALRSLREVCRLENAGQRAPWLALLVQNAISREDLRRSVQDILDESSKPKEPALALLPAAESRHSEGKTQAEHLVETGSAVMVSSGPSPETSLNASGAELRTEERETEPVTLSSPGAETLVVRENSGSGVSSDDYRKGQLQSYRTMISRDTKSLQAILDRWTGFLNQDPEVAGLFREGILKAAGLFGEARNQIAPEPDTLS
jgi:ParB/RepB/Spo0J family partition protein